MDWILVSFYCKGSLFSRPSAVRAHTTIAKSCVANVFSKRKVVNSWLGMSDNTLFYPGRCTLHSQAPLYVVVAGVEWGWCATTVWMVFVSAWLFVSFAAAAVEKRCKGIPAQCHFCDSKTRAKRHFLLI